MVASGLCYVGVDWGHVGHQVYLEDATREHQAEARFAGDGEGFQALSAWLTAQTGGDLSKVMVAIETCHSAVVDGLCELGIPVWVLPPAQVVSFRNRYGNSGAKDDRRDARLLAQALRQDLHCFRQVNPLPGAIVELREWSRLREELIELRIRLEGRIRAQLQRYYPQLLGLGGSLTDDFLAALFAQAPTPADAKKLTEAQLAELLRTHRIRRISAEALAAQLRAPDLPAAAGVAAAASAHLGMLFAQANLVRAQVREADKALKTQLLAMQDVPAHAQIAPASPTHTDEGAHGTEVPAAANMPAIAADATTDIPVAVGAPAETKPEETNPAEISPAEISPAVKSEQSAASIILSLPGAGPYVAATLLSEAYHLIQDASYHELRVLAGIAPVTQQSGKSQRVSMRRACSLRLRDAMYHCARVAMQRDPLSKAKYAQLRSRGHSHGRALRTVADRLLKVLCAMLRNRDCFCPEKRSHFSAAA